MCVLQVHTRNRKLQDSANCGHRFSFLHRRSLLKTEGIDTMTRKTNRDTIANDKL